MTVSQDKALGGFSATNYQVFVALIIVGEALAPGEPSETRWWDWDLLQKNP